MTDKLRISVIIPTRNRADSLENTLHSLAVSNRLGFDVDIIVVDNAGSDDSARKVVASYETRLSVRYLYEPKTGTYGKSHALNKALGAESLGTIVAVLDDDMSVHENWFRGVVSICERWPDVDLFTGKTYVIWPLAEVPDWALDRNIHGWQFSVDDFGTRDTLLQSGQWFLGGHFWFRSRVLKNDRRFEDTWLTEALFMLKLVEEGYKGVYGPDAVVGHRIQRELLKEDVAVDRAVKMGKDGAEARMKPYRESVRASRLFKNHPVIARLFCVAKILQWNFAKLFARFNKSHERSFGKLLLCTKELTYYKTLLRIAHELDEYRIMKNQDFPRRRRLLLPQR